MKFLEALVASVCIMGLSACTMPGLKYRSGGSDVWKDERGDKGAQIQEITVQLVAAEVRDSKMRQDLLVQTPIVSGAQAALWQYRVGIGDILHVIVWDHPELTNPTGSTEGTANAGRVIRPDGTIFYPYVGKIVVVGKTTEEIGELLAGSLAKIIQRPQVDVSVLQYRSQYVSVVGDVEQPCRVPVTDMALTMIDALNGCKTIRPTTGNREIELNRDGRRRTADLYSIYKGRTSLFEEPLLGGDVLYVKDDRANRVFVVGEVSRQAAINIPISGLTLADAINNQDIGGIKQEATDASNIYVFRGGVRESDVQRGQLSREEFRPEVFHINIASADALLLADQFQLQPRDVVLASTAPIINYGRAVSLIFTPVTTLVQMGTLLQNSR